MYNPGQEMSSINFGAIIGGTLNAVVTAQSQSANTTVDFIKKVGFEKKQIQDEDGTKRQADVPINVAFTYDKEVSPAQFKTINKWNVKVKKGGTGYQSADKASYSLSVNGTELTIKELKIESGSITSIEIEELPQDISLQDGAKVTLKYEGERAASAEDAELVMELNQSYEEVPALIQKMQIQVPLLTMVPIPFIKIDNAEIEFNAKINSVSSQESSSVTDTKVNSGASYGFWTRASINASVSNQSKHSSSEEVKKDYSLNIKVHAVQDDMPAGVSRILDMLEDSIIARPMNAPKESKEPAKVEKSATPK